MVVADLEEINSFLPSKVSKLISRYGSFVDIYIEHTENPLLLWIYLCDWVIEVDGCEVLNSESKKLSAVLNKFILNSIIVKFAISDVCICIHISDGVEFKLFPNTNLYGNGSMINVYLPNEDCLSYRPLTGIVRNK